MSVISDWRRVRRLGRYLVHDRRRLLLTLVLLVPVAVAGAIQPPVSYTHLTLPTSR